MRAFWNDSVVSLASFSSNGNWALERKYEPIFLMMAERGPEWPKPPALVVEERKEAPTKRTIRVPDNTLTTSLSVIFGSNLKKFRPSLSLVKKNNEALSA
jgi:hypothetical protein